MSRDEIIKEIEELENYLTKALQVNREVKLYSKDNRCVHISYDGLLYDICDGDKHYFGRSISDIESALLWMEFTF